MSEHSIAALFYCGALGEIEDEAPQLKRFYTVPLVHTHIPALLSLSLSLSTLFPDIYTLVGITLSICCLRKHSRSFPMIEKVIELTSFVNSNSVT